MSYGILEDLDSLLPVKYDRYIGDAPANIDCMMLSDIPYLDVQPTTKQRVGIISRLVSFWVRSSPVSGVYTTVEDDLYAYWLLIRGYSGKVVGNKSIVWVGKQRVVPLGRDENGNFIFSLSFPIQYKLTSEV